MTAAQRASYERDGFLVLPDFLFAADCDALRARAAELVAGFDTGPARTIFSAVDQSHARDRYFRESGDDIRFFFEKAPDQLNKIGHALHDLDPVFDRISRQPKLATLAGELGLAQPLLLQSMYIFKHPGIGGEVGWHQDATCLHTTPVSPCRAPIGVPCANASAGPAMQWSPTSSTRYRGRPSSPCRSRSGATRWSCCTACCRTPAAPTARLGRVMPIRCI